jgi:predicted kinase
VRAKVAVLRADQLQGPPHDVAIGEAHQHLALADSYSSPWLMPLVIIVGGLAGTGKTTLATALAASLGAELLRTDVIRQELFGIHADTETVDGGKYRPETRERVYQEMFRRGEQLHADRVSIIFDATFSTATSFQQAEKLATDPRSVLLGVECLCRPEVAHKRITQRLAAGHDPSAARPEIYDVQRTRWQSWPQTAPRICIDTELPLSQQVEQVLAALRSCFGSAGSTAALQPAARK